ncbi:MAG: hypothetical protein QOF01_3282 [Thermomicrobiales bacterium]|nr:hypothetical protein [Thermomicrobiales bacterium]MEA2596813.1 hypothetical protein [Thermomicrobiales bacterium]
MPAAARSRILKLRSEPSRSGQKRPATDGLDGKRTREDDMDGTQFDSIARTWATGMSRRRALRGLAAAVVGLVVAPVARSEAAVCYASGESCNADSECCQGTCTLGYCRCPAGKVNCNGLCRDNCDGCPTGFRKCNGICRDLKTDSTNCGICGNTCRKGSHCSNGKCCGQGQVNCGGACVPQIQCS